MQAVRRGRAPGGAETSPAGTTTSSPQSPRAVSAATAEQCRHRHCSANSNNNNHDHGDGSTNNSDSILMPLTAANSNTMKKRTGTAAAITPAASHKDRIGHHAHAGINRRHNNALRQTWNDIKIRWRLLSRYSQLMIIFVIIPTISFHVLIQLYDMSFHYYGPLRESHYQQQEVFDADNNKMRPPPGSPGFSVVINTYKRPQMLHDAVYHYAHTCGKMVGVQYVFVIWAELDVTPPTIASLFANNNNLRNKQLRTSSSSSSTDGSTDGSTSTSTTSTTTTNTKKSHLTKQQRYKKEQRSTVRIIRVAKDSLNSRFLPIVELDQQQKNATTANTILDGIFMVDDDIRVDCGSLYRGYQAWRAAPASMVGYYPRLAHNAQGQQQQQNEDVVTRPVEYVYESWPQVWFRQRMNFVLTKAAFLHQRYLAIYSDPAQHPTTILDYVDKWKNCEDVAMSMLVANQTRAERMKWRQRPKTTSSTSTTSTIPCGVPIYIEGRIYDKGLFNGISTGPGHMDRRSQCLTDLSRIYQQHGWPLPLEDAFALEEASWMHHAPGFWFQSRPSNVFEWFALGNLF